jgi:ComF family protein
LLARINNLGDSVRRMLMHNPRSVLTAVTNGVLSVLVAPTCAACGAVLEAPLAGCVCRVCWGEVHAVADIAFDRGTPLERLTAVGEYDGAFREIIHALKYQGRRSIAAGLAGLMRKTGEEVLCNADCVVPVPLHWRREYARGFNQARDIARHLQRPVLDGLVRSRPTVPQVELSKEQRLKNVEGVFALKRPRLRKAPALDGVTVLLIDDVATTGATMVACAAVLKRAGAAHVWGLTAARKV